MAKDTPRSLIDELAWSAHTEPFLSARIRGESAQEYVRRGLPIPDHLLPGRAIQRLSPERRAILADLRPDDTVPGGLWMQQVLSGRWDGKA